MNYTKPDSPGHVDRPTDWLKTSLVFAAALGKILQENEGISIDLTGDMPEYFPGMKRVIVFKENEMVKIMENDQPMPNGQMVWLGEERLENP